MSQKTHFIIQLDGFSYYKLHTFMFNDNNKMTLHNQLREFFTLKRLRSFMISLQEILLIDSFINIHHFKKPLHDEHEWIILKTQKKHRGANEYVFILQRTSEGFFVPIPICDIHKMPQKLISYNESSNYLEDYLDEALCYKTSGKSMNHNEYNKTISLFELMLCSIDLNKIGKKRRFH